MEKIYIALVDTPGFFASLIRKYIKIPYVHVAVSLDSHLEEAYSIGRRNPFIPVFAGFEREEKHRIWKAFPDAGYMVYSLPCTVGQKDQITRVLRECYKERFSYHYCVAGLPFLLAGREFYQKNHYTCSSFAARLLEDCGIKLFDKHFSLVTPKDFYEIAPKEIVFEGRLSELILEDACVSVGRGVAYEG